MISPEFSIPVKDLDAGGRTYDFPVRAAWMRGALEDHEARPSGPDGMFHVRASKSGTDVIIQGRLQAQLEAPCARCLEPAAFTIDKKVSALMVPAAKSVDPTDPEYEVSAEEADTFPYDGETAILDDLVHDELVLETPMIPLCSEACPGMSAASDGAKQPPGEPAESIDPRLLPLLRIKLKS